MKRLLRIVIMAPLVIPIIIMLWLFNDYKEIKDMVNFLWEGKK